MSVSQGVPNPRPDLEGGPNLSVSLGQTVEKPRVQPGKTVPREFPTKVGQTKLARL